MYLSQDYRDIIEIFHEQGVRYLLVGAYAMAIFGYARSTYDIDLWIDNAQENVQKVLIALDAFGVPFEITAEDLSKDYAIIQIGLAPIRIDILTTIDGVDFDEAYQNRVEHHFGDLVASVLHIDDIIKNKLASSRAKDKIDADELLKLKEMKNV